MINIESKVKTDNNNVNDKILDYVGWLLLFAMILLLRFAQNIINNIIDTKSFMVEYGLIGALIASTFLFLVYKFNRNYFKGGEKRASAVLSYFFGITFLTIFVTAYFDLKICKENQQLRKAFIVQKSTNIKYGSKILKLNINGKIEKFNPTVAEWNEIQENEIINLIVCRGVSGYEHILKFNAK